MKIEPFELAALIVDLNKYKNAISSYSGNEFTNYKPFQTLMVEEKINILADILCILIALEIERLKDYNP